MNDQPLIELIRTGKHSLAIEVLYQHYPKVRSLIQAKGGTPEDARDIFQEALLVLCKKADQPDFELTCSAGTYLYSVSRFLWKDELKKRNRRNEIEPPPQPLPDLRDDILEIQEREAAYGHLDQVLKQVGEKCLKLLKMFYFERLSMTKIAKAFGFSSDRSAKTQKYKCLERARKLAQQPVVLSTLKSGSHES